ncbi:MAG: PD-(D/E)XK nuclease family protein [Elainellaceae cyanobacterium]
MLHLSQGQLNLLELCPRRFQHVYLEQLGTLVTPDQQERLSWGTQFHLLMQQRAIGLPIAIDPTLNDPLRQCVEAFVQTAPELFQPDPNTIRQSEHRRLLEFQGYLLTVIYDLIILEEDKAQILDWKTYPRPQNSGWLAQNWQTRLYPFVLAETSSYAPEQISMTYWFVQTSVGEGTEPKPLTFRYDSQQHQQIARELTDRLSQLSTWLHAYEAGQPFPQVAETIGYCDTCSFTKRCQRGETDRSGSEPMPKLADIEEVVV